MRLGDQREEELPPLGYLELEDPESGERVVVNTSSPAFRLAFREESDRRTAALAPVAQRWRDHTALVRPKHAIGRTWSRR